MTVHGTARFATRGELRMAGLLPGSGLGPAVAGLHVGFWHEGAQDFEPIRYNGDLHQLVVGGTGGGKFTTALGPLLLGSALDDQTVVVVDPKGEIAQLVGPFFERPFGEQARVHILDPWNECGTGETSALNIVDTIRADSPSYVDDARALADAMIIPSGDENTHWDNTARNFLAAALLYVALDPKEDGRRDLTRVREIATMAWAMPKAYKGPSRPTLSALLFELRDSTLAEGAVARGCTGLLNREDKERSGIISSIERDTAWIDSPPMKRVLTGPSLDLKQIASGGHKVFVVLPVDYFRTHRAWLRLMITAFAKAFKRTRAEPSRPSDQRWRHIVIDEFANLGEMSFILNDIAVARGYAIKYHLTVQDFSQLKAVYEDSWESFVNNSFQRFFAVSDLFTADYVSRMSGSATVASESIGFGSSYSHGSSLTESAGASEGVSQGESRHPPTYSVGGSSSVARSDSHTWGSSESRSTSQVQRQLLTPDEVRRLGQDEQLLFFRGMHPARTWRPPYYDCFVSLPPYTLKAVFGTIGRKPASDEELLLWNSWRESFRLIAPAPRVPALASPAAAQANDGRSIGAWLFADGPVIAFAVLLIFAWLWPNTPQP